MIQYSVVKAGDSRVVAVLVERRILGSSAGRQLLSEVGAQLSMPVMLVARDETALAGARAFAEFDPMPYLYALLRTRDIDWTPLPHERFQLEGV